LKQLSDIERCAAAGYTMFTIDPSEHVDATADDATPQALEANVASLPWSELETNWTDTRARFGRPVDLLTSRVAIAEIDVLRAAAKYGKAIAHTVAMVRRVREATPGTVVDVEVSVDESATVTTIAEHVYIATELRRLGVQWTSLAPRYVGEFEKGVDYIGDLAAFEQSFAQHLAVARALGPYRLSLHSGSDKFSIFPIAARLASDVHLKTSGTTYLEALRTVAALQPSLFREIATLARDRYAHDRIGYHVSAERDRMRRAREVADAALPALLDQFDAREVLHVTFGSVIADADLWARFLDVLRSHEEEYHAALEKHFARHFAPFETYEQEP
jgi:tagaturonate epimerase